VSELDKGASCPFVVEGALLNAYAALSRYAASLLENAEVGNTDEATMYGTALAASMLDHCDAIELLIRSQKGNAALGGMVRAQFELLGVLAYFFKDPQAALKNEFHRTWGQLKQVERHAKDSPNGAFTVKTDKQLAALSKQFPDFATGDFKPQHNRQLLNAVHPDAYAVYQTFCLEAHNNFQAVRRRHFENMPAGTISLGRSADRSFATFVIGMSSYCVDLACRLYLDSRSSTATAQTHELRVLFDRINALGDAAR
jgi:Family of unknown function (DUF5677)